MVTKGDIVAVQWYLETTTSANGDGWLAELSYSNTNQTLVNNPTGIISIAGMRIVNQTGVGFGSTAQQLFDAGLRMPVGVGDLVYVNVTLAGTGSGRCLFRVD